MTNTPTIETTLFDRAHLSKLVLLGFAVWLHAASSLLAATTLPSAVRNFGGGHLIGWAFSLYLLGSILAGASTGSLVRTVELRTALISAAGVYLIGSVICAIAPDMTVVLIGRLIQGIGGGFLVALVYVAIRHWFAKEQLAKVMALISAIWSMSAFAGPLVGGTFATFGNWRMAYVAASVQALVFIGLTLTDSSKLAGDDAAPKPSIPLERFGLVFLSVLAVAYAGADVQLVKSSGFLMLGIALFVVALRLDASKSAGRLFPSQPLNLASKVGAGLLMILAASIASMSFMVYGPIMLETLHGITPLAAGYMIAFESVCWGAMAVLVARLNTPNEARLIRLGTTLLVVSLAGFATTMKSGPVLLILVFAGFQGAGFGLMWAFVVKRITENAAASEVDETSSAIPTMQQLGFAFGAAISGIVANSVGFGDLVTFDIASAAAVWIFAGFIPFALVAFVAGRRLAA